MLGEFAQIASPPSSARPDPAQRKRLSAGTDKLSQDWIGVDSPKGDICFKHQPVKIRFHSLDVKSNRPNHAVFVVLDFFGGNFSAISNE